MLTQLKGRHLARLDKLDDSSIIVDAGACVGEVIEDLRRLEQTKKCRIFAIECNKDNLKILKGKKFTNVEIIDKALTGQDEGNTVTFYQFSQRKEWGNIGGHFLAHRHIGNVKTYKVSTSKINDIFSELGIEKIDYFKMDIEGAEKGIFDTMSMETASKIKQISVEFHSPSGAGREYMEEKLDDLGFIKKGDNKNEIFCERE